MGKVSANGLCSKQHILHLLYATLFLLPLNPFLFYITLLPAIGAWLYNWKRQKEVGLSLPPLWQMGAVFLLCSFLSAFVSKNTAFSLMNWALQPLMYGLLYLLIYTTVSTEKEKEKALYAWQGPWSPWPTASSSMPMQREWRRIWKPRAGWTRNVFPSFGGACTLPLKTPIFLAPIC